MPFCEDYPCCGHTPDDPCTREWYDDVDWHAYSAKHAGCDHEAGFYCCDEDDDGDVIDPRYCDHNSAYETPMGARSCDDCLADLMVVTDVSPKMYPSKVIPGMWVEIPVLGWHLEVAS